jgi:hypothetical protein
MSWRDCWNASGSRHFFCAANNGAQHTGKNQSVNGGKGVPVQQPCQSSRLKERCLPDSRRTITQGKRVELQPCSARKAHLGTKTEPSRWIKLLYSPEVDRFADDKV